MDGRLRKCQKLNNGSVRPPRSTCKFGTFSLSSLARGRHRTVGLQPASQIYNVVRVSSVSKERIVLQLLQVVPSADIEITRWRSKDVDFRHDGLDGHHLKEGIAGTKKASTDKYVNARALQEEPGGLRPEAFAEPRPQQRVQRHVVEHLTDLVRVGAMVQILDALVPQMETFRLSDPPMAEQVIAVPKVFLLILSFPRGSP